MTQRFKWVLAAIAFGPIMIVLMAAGVNGIFNNITVNGNAAVTGTINSTTGYKTNGSVGAAGQALCSDGTYYDTACSIPGGTVYYQTIENASFTPQTQRGTLYFSGNFGIADSTSPPVTKVDLTLTGVGGGTYAYPSSLTVDNYGRVSSVTAGSPYSPPAFTGTSGYQLINRTGGLILQWGLVYSVPTGTGSNYSLPITFPHGCFGVNATDNGGSAIGSNPRSIGTGCVSTSQIWLVSSGTPSGPVFYTAIGY